MARIAKGNMYERIKTWTPPQLLWKDGNREAEKEKQEKIVEEEKIGKKELLVFWSKMFYIRRFWLFLLVSRA